MSIIPVFVGLDYHQNSVQVCVIDQSGKVLGNRGIANDACAIEKYCRRFGEPQRMGIEACCGSADLSEELVTQHQLPLQMAHAGYVNRMKKSPDKTDFGDAQMLADLARVNYLPEVWLAPEQTRQLRRLVRHRKQLVNRRKDVKLRIRGLLRENRLKYADAQSWTRRWLHWLEHTAPLGRCDRLIIKSHLSELQSLAERITEVEKEIQVEVKDDPMVAKLMEMPGVGLVTAVTFRAEVGRVERFKSGKQLARFCGVTPRNASSGTRQADAGLIRAGNPELRTVLIELAHRLINTRQEPSASLTKRMLKNGKPKNVIVAAVANRWVRSLYHQLKQSSLPGVSLPDQTANVSTEDDSSLSTST